MAKYVLTIGKNYVSEWTVENAIRELIQNKIDQENIDPENIGTITTTGGVLTIANKLSKLSKSSLVLGETTKGDGNSIGKFGEGYKLALVVLLRNGIDVVIHNYYEAETWVPAIEYVKDFDAELLVINTEKHWLKGVPDNNLSFVITGIDNIDKVISHITLDKEDYKVIPTTLGDILMDGPKGNIYVSSLFVTHIDKLDYSYNFKPNYIEIGRDRNLVDTFSIQMQVENMWSQVPEELEDTLVDMLQSGSADIYSTRYDNGSMRKVAPKLLNNLNGKYPVSTQSEAEEVKRVYGKNLQTVIVSPEVKAVVKPLLETKIYAKVKIFTKEDFYIRHKKKFTKNMLKDWQLIKG